MYDDNSESIRKLFTIQSIMDDISQGLVHPLEMDNVSWAINKVASSAQSLLSDTLKLKKILIEANANPADESECKDGDVETVAAPSSDEEKELYGKAIEEPLPKPRPNLTHSQVCSPIRFVENADSIYGKIVHPRITDILGGAPRKHYYALVYRVRTRMIIGCVIPATYPRIIPLNTEQMRFVEMEIPQFFYVPVEDSSEETISHY